MIPLRQQRIVAWTVIIGLLTQSSGLLACVNTRYSRDEERQITGVTVKLIMGQFAHHGETFYEDQILTTSAELEEDSGNVEAKNDRAVAYLKLGQYERAEEEFRIIEESHPGRYRTHANQGVLYKKMGDFEKAAHHVRRSLEIQPEGHLGLGDYYVRMIDWLGDRKNDAPKLTKSGKIRKGKFVPPNTNFLGIAYAAGPMVTATNSLVNREYLETLIKADRTFPDVLVVLGDVLQEEGEMELAYRAYHRAKMLKHPADREISNRMTAIHRLWQRAASEKDGFIVLPYYQLEGQLNNEAEQAADWVRVYETAEGDLVAEGKYVDIASVKKAMASYEYVEPKYLFAGVVKGRLIKPSQKGMYVAVVVFFSVCALVLVGFIWLIRVFMRRYRAQPIFPQ